MVLLLESKFITFAMTSSALPLISVSVMSTISLASLAKDSTWNFSLTS